MTCLLLAFLENMEMEFIRKVVSLPWIWTNKLLNIVSMRMSVEDRVLEFMKKELSHCLENQYEQEVPHSIQHISKLKS